MDKNLTSDLTANPSHSKEEKKRLEQFAQAPGRIGVEFARCKICYVGLYQVPNSHVFSEHICTAYLPRFLKTEGVLFYDPLADVCFLKDLTLFYSVSLYFVYFSCTAQIHKLKFISEYYYNTCEIVYTGNPTLIS